MIQGGREKEGKERRREREEENWQVRWVRYRICGGISKAKKAG